MGFEVTYLGSGSPFERKNIVNVNFNYIKDAFYFDFFSNSKIMKMTDGSSMGLIGSFSFKKIWNIIKDYDLYYFVTPDIIFSKAVKNFKKYNYDPVIILANHGTYFEILKSKNNFFSNFLRIILNTIILRKAIGRITVQTQNNFQEEYYRSLGFDDILTIPQDNISFNDYYYMISNEFHVVFLNKLTKNKGLDLLLKIIENNKRNDIFFDIVGYGDNDYINYLNKKFENKNARFFGFVDDYNKKNILAKSDVMVNCSLYESLSISAIEGLASGLTVIAPDISGINYIKNFVPEGIKIVDYDYKSYLKEIYNIYDFKNSLNAYIELKKSIKEEAKKIFDENVISKRIEEMVNKALKYNDNRYITVIASFKNNINEKLKALIYYINENNLNINEIILINSKEKIDNLNFDVKTLNYKNYNKGSMELKASFKAKNDLIMVINDNIVLNGINKLIYEKSKGYDVVIGSRYNKIKTYHRLLNKAAAFITSILLVNTRNIKDPLSDFYIFDRKILKNIKIDKDIYKSLIYLITFSKTKKYKEIQVNLNDDKFTLDQYLKYSLLYSRELMICYRDYYKYNNYLKI